jgi:Short C-terminal domain
MFPRRPVARRRPLLRAAAVGGGAYLAGRATANRAADREAREADQEARISDLEQAQQNPQAQAAQAQVPQQPGPAAEPQGSPMLDQLNQLAAMHSSGVLTDEEFAAAKAKLLG